MGSVAKRLPKRMLLLFLGPKQFIWQRTEMATRDASWEGAESACAWTAPHLCAFLLTDQLGILADSLGRP